MCLPPESLFPCGERKHHQLYVGRNQQHAQGARTVGLLDVRLQRHVVVHQALVVAVLDRRHALDVLHQVFDEQVLVSKPGVQPGPSVLHGVCGLDLDGQLLGQTHLSELLEQFPRRCAAVVG
ncbi:MAG: hypothetical protein ACK56I_13415, partial [bacterium]